MYGVISDIYVALPRVCGVNGRLGARLTKT